MVLDARQATEGEMVSFQRARCERKGGLVAMVAPLLETRHGSGIWEHTRQSLGADATPSHATPKAFRLPTSSPFHSCHDQDLALAGAGSSGRSAQVLGWIPVWCPWLRPGGWKSSSNNASMPGFGQGMARA